jgi:hypothetical protein
MKTTNNFRKIIAFVLAFATMNLALSCNYFRIIKVEDITAELGKDQIRYYQNLNKYFILHNLDKSYHIQIIKLDADNNRMEVELADVGNQHNNYFTDSGASHRYKPGTMQEVSLSEVHLYTNSSLKLPASGRAEVPMSSLTRMDIIEHDSGRTVASYVFTTLGITGATFGLIALIALLLKSSCPFVYAYNGKEYKFIGEIYGGAIFRPLERDDYMPLGEATPGSLYKIRISNELREIQYTNLAELIVAEHDSSVKTCIDSKGIVHSLSAPVYATSAVLNEKTDVLKELEQTDSSYCLFNSENRNHFENQLHLKFPKPGNAKMAKLILQAKNSWWLDYSFTKFTQLFGNYYNRFVEEKRNANKDSLLAWSSANGMPMAVYFKTTAGWKQAEEIPTVGPMAARQFCVPINLANVDGKQLEIKISCGFLTWELDQAYVDYSSDAAIISTTLDPVRATKENGESALESLLSADGLYLVQPDPGNTCEIEYAMPATAAGKRADCYLHARGYYEHVRNYTGLPNRDVLMTFKQKGTFSEFTHSLYQKVSENTGMVPSAQASR